MSLSYNINKLMTNFIEVKQKLTSTNSELVETKNVLALIKTKLELVLTELTVVKTELTIVSINTEHKAHIAKLETDKIIAECEAKYAIIIAKI